MTVYQGEQYALPLEICFGNKLLTPQDCDDVKIQIGTLCKRFGAGELSFDPEEKLWQFPLTQAESRELDLGRTPVQVMVRQGLELHVSRTEPLYVGRCIIEEDWE
ncbi:MAG: hypothetical protein IKS29_02670 [Oscillospiraceae bacterium]|nr:hypothetical protein [Oscillospiraceae bacterium]